MHHDKDGLHPRFIRAAGFALTLALSLSLVPLSARAAQPMSLTQALTTCQTSLPAQGPNPAVTVLAIGAGSSCSAVTIGTGDVAAFNAASPLMPVIVGKGGTLTVSDPGGGHATTLYASSFLIQNGGAMLAGTTAKPVAGQITIVMAGHASAALPPTHNDLIANARDITVMDGGVLALYGAKGISGPADINTLYGTNSWTYLAAPAGPAKYNDTENVSAPVPTTTPATVLTLARVVDWQVNDWIAVATTGFSSHQTEIVQVCGNKPVANPDSGISPTPAVTGVPAYTIANMPQTVSQITLCPATPLKHYHYGGLAPTPGFFPAATTQTVIAGGKPIVVSHQARSFYDNSTRNYGIDERAEVALLSRNIKLTSIAGSRPFVIAGASNANPVVITVPAGSPVPANGDQVTVGGVLGNTAANGTWTVSASTPGTATAAGSFALQGANGIAGKAYTPGSGTAVVPEGSLQTYAIAGASNASPIVITVPPSTPVPNNGQQVAINSVEGNTAANGTWTVVSSTPGSGTSGGTFALLNSNGTNGGAYTGGGNVVVHEGLYAGAHLVAMHSPPSAATPTLQLVGVELEKFGQAFVGRYPVHLHHVNAPQSTITGAATASKGTNIVISSAAVPADGMFVAVSGVQGDTAANGIWPVVNTKPAKGTFELAGSIGNGAYTSGGSWSDAAVVKDVSVHHSYNKCFTVHGSTNADFYNNVCVRTVGQGFYLEDGTNIKRNQFMHNLVAGTMAATSTYSYPQQNGSQYWDGDYLQQAQTTQPNWYTINNIPDTSNTGRNGSGGLDTGFPNGFWITNLGNTFVNNSVAGCQAQGRAYWMLGQDPTQNSAYPEFTGNRAHGCYNGIDTNDDTVAAINPAPMPPNPTYTIEKAHNSAISISSALIPAATSVVTINGTNLPTPGPWKVTNTGATSFDISYGGVTPTSPYSGSGGSWQPLAVNVIKIDKAPGKDIIVTVAGGIPPPADNAQIVISGTGTAADNTAAAPWTVKHVKSGMPSSLSTFMLQGTSNASATGFPSTSGQWQLQPQAITAVAVAPIVVKSTTVPANGAQVQITGVQGNTAANGIWSVTTPAAGGGADTFSLNGSVGNGAYTGCGQWQIAPQPPVLVLNDNTVTRSRQRGFWGRGIFTTLHNDRFATNPYGFSLLGGGGPEGNVPGFWGLVHDNVIAGMTRNNVERYPGCSNANNNFEQECTDVVLSSTSGWGNYPTPNAGGEMNIQGYSYYDGPARIEHNRFVNFRFDPTGLHPNDPAARLVTKTDIALMAKNLNGQLHGTPEIVTTGKNGKPKLAPTSLYNGYAGDPAMGWIQTNAQTVPPTQYMENNIWDNVDFKHQVYTEAVNLGSFDDGDKSTVILDRDSQLSGLRVVDANNNPAKDVFPVSLNNLDYFATDFTVDEAHSRGPNDFRSTSLMSPHKYATLNIESANDPMVAQGKAPTFFHVQIQRDMAAYHAADYPSLFLNGRGQNPIYEPFVMDRMGYTVFGKSGTENYPANQKNQSFNDRLLFSYTDPAVKRPKEFFVNRIAVYQPVTNPSAIKVYRIRRQWGQQYTGAQWPNNFNPPGPAASTCDGTFFASYLANPADIPVRWNDCLARANNAAPPTPYPGSPALYSGGMVLPAAAGSTAAVQWTNFELPFKTLMAIAKPTETDIAQFIAGQSYYYDTTGNLLYFYMIEDAPVQRLHAPYGTCGGGATQYGANVAQLQQLKNYSDQASVKAALDASCSVTGGAPQPTELVTCGPNGCAAYMVDFGGAPNLNAPPACTPGQPCTPAPAHPIARSEYKSWNQYTLVYGTPAQPNGLPAVANSSNGNSTAPTDGGTLAGPTIPKATGHQVTYTFSALTLNANPAPPANFPVEQNFDYRCLTTAPWSPVNARGTYPTGGGSTYPLAPLVCAP